MKKRNRIVSIILCVCMILVMLSSSAVQAEREVAEIADDMAADMETTESSFEVDDAEKLTYDNVPDIVGYEHAVDMGHIARDKNKEKDLYSLVFKNVDGTNTMYIYSDPIKYIDENGLIKDKSNRIVSDNLNLGCYTNAANDIKVLFPHNIYNGISL